MTCRVCGGGALAPVFSIPAHPVCTRFLASAGAPDPRFDLDLAVCATCASTQLTHPVPVASLVAPYDWIRYNEPEGHLDDLADRLRAFPGIGSGSVVCGVSSKDDTLLARLVQRGVGRTWRVDLAGDLGTTEPGAGLESIQDRLTPAVARDLAARHGAADIVLARHIFEHAYDFRAFAQALAALAKPGGLVVLETPDCSASFDAGDCTVVWEEHLVYLTPATFRGLVARCGLGLVAERCYPYPYENSLVIVATSGGGSVEAAPVDLAAERARVDRFGALAAARRSRVRAWVRAEREAGRRLALFGAGHLACTFIQSMDIAADLIGAIDDHPRKQGLYMPGSGLPILPSSALADIDVALMTLSPESEANVVRRQQAFTDRGGRLLSIFPNSRLALDRVLEGDAS